MAARKDISKRVFNGTHGALWIDDDLISQVEAFEAKISLVKTDVKMVGVHAKMSKMVGWEGSGKMTLNKVSSYFINKLAEATIEGRTVEFRITSRIGDPDAIGTERILLTGVTLDGFDLANFKAQELASEEIDFTFTDFEILDATGDLVESGGNV